jgi:hypothetical protein
VNDTILDILDALCEYIDRLHGIKGKSGWSPAEVRRFEAAEEAARRLVEDRRPKVPALGAIFNEAGFGVPWEEPG